MHTHTQHLSQQDIVLSEPSLSLNYEDPELLYWADRLSNVDTVTPIQDVHTIQINDSENNTCCSHFDIASIARFWLGEDQVLQTSTATTVSSSSSTINLGMKPVGITKSSKTTAKRKSLDIKCSKKENWVWHDHFVKKESKEKELVVTRNLYQKKTTPFDHMVTKLTLF